jgi:hypothetical protein
MTTVSSDRVWKELVNLKETEKLTPWETGFAESLAEWYQKHGSITKKQHDTLQKVLARYSDEAKELRESWAVQYCENKRSIATLMAKYYIANPPYFHSLASEILNEEGFIPTEKQYKSMCENKYAKKIVALIKSDPQFDIGQMVQLRQIPHNHRHEGKLAIILEYLPEIYSAAKGARRLNVLMIGDSLPMQTEERWLKRAKI